MYLPSEETGKLRKLSQPWHGPYQIISRDDPDVTVTKVYFPDDPPLKIHQLRIKNCPVSFPCGYYWYGSKRRRPGRPPKWVEKLMNQPPAIVEPNSSDIVHTPKDKQRKKSSRKKSPQQLKEADNLLPTTGNQGGEQPRSPYNLRHRQRGLTRNINSRTSLVSEGICNGSGTSHLIS